MIKSHVTRWNHNWFSTVNWYIPDFVKGSSWHTGILLSFNIMSYHSALFNSSNMQTCKIRLEHWRILAGCPFLMPSTTRIGIKSRSVEWVYHLTTESHLLFNRDRICAHLSGGWSASGSKHVVVMDSNEVVGIVRDKSKWWPNCVLLSAFTIDINHKNVKQPFEQKL